MFKRAGIWVIAVVVAWSATLLPTGRAVAAAEDRPEIVKGLLITPTRNFTTQPAGSQRQANFTIGNLTSSDITVDLSVKRFGVTDYRYDYRFDTPDNNWVGLSTQQVTLKPNQSRQVTYTITVPPGTAGGGHYYTLFASANLERSGIKSTVQATLLVYLTVQGNLDKSNIVQSSSYQQVAFGRQVGYNVVVRNTGNVHYFVYTNAHLTGWLTGPRATDQSHLLLPASTRILNGSVAAPVFPGLYRLSYGFRSEDGKQTDRYGWVLYVPPWSIALVAAALLLWRIRRQRHRKAIRARHDPND